jgi:hypothetical protein
MSGKTDLDIPTVNSNNNPAPTKDEIPEEAKKIIEQSQVIQAQIQGAQVAKIKNIHDLIKGIDDEKVQEIEKQFKDGVIVFEVVDDNGKLTKQSVPYIPLTTRAESEINKVLRKLKAFKYDVENKIPLEELQRKYPEIATDVDSLEELAPEKTKYPVKDDAGVIQRDKKGNIIYDEKLTDSDTYITLVNNYIVDKKCEIYFKIKDISNYSRKDLRALIFLYEYRNAYNPYYISQT